MEQLIGLTTYSKGGTALPTAQFQVFDIDSIVSPIVITGGKATFRYKSKLPHSGYRDIIEYKVNESLATIVQLSKRFVSLTVTKRAGTVLASVTTLFLITKITETVLSSNSGAKFLYNEENDQDPTEYIVAESPTDILVQANSQARSRTGMPLTFDVDAAFYGNVTDFELGDIIYAVTDKALAGATATIFHKTASAPVFGPYFHLVSGTYDTSKVNRIVCIFVDETTIDYHIYQVGDVSPDIENLDEDVHDDTSIDILWDDAGAASYDIYYGPSPLTAPDPGTVPTDTSATPDYSATGLDPDTEYVFYVRANDTTMVGPWAGPLTVTTDA